MSSIYDSLLKGYQDDVEKYAKGEKQTDVIRFILSEGWSKAGQIIKLGNFAGSSYKSGDAGNAFRTLEKTMLLELVYPSTSADLPAIGELIWLRGNDSSAEDEVVTATGKSFKLINRPFYLIGMLPRILDEIC